VMSETSWHIAGGTVLQSSRLEPCFTRLHVNTSLKSRSKDWTKVLPLGLQVI